MYRIRKPYGFWYVEYSDDNGDSWKTIARTFTEWGAYSEIKKHKSENGEYFN